MRNALLALLFSCACLGLRAGEPRFTYADIAAGKFAAKTVAGLRPSADGDFYYTREDAKIVRHRYDTGAGAGTLFDAKSLDPNMDFGDYVLSPDEGKVLVATNVKLVYRHSFTADWLLYDAQTGQLNPLTEEGREQEPLFSPDGLNVGFVRDNNLYVKDLKTDEIKAITTDGERNKVINGLPDWVYEEEYATTRTFCFSPDSRRIAWLRLDESAVPQYTFMKYQGQLYPQSYTYKYPKAGQANSKPQVFTADLQSDETTRVDLDYTEIYVPRLGFTPEGALWVMAVNRRQNELDVSVETRPGVMMAAYREIADKYVERPDDATVTFLPGGKMVVSSETSGRRHLYLYEKRGAKYSRRTPVTQGDWDVEQLVSIAAGKAYYLSNEGSPLRRNLWSVGLDGKNKRRMTPEEGYYTVSPGAEMKYYVSTFSNATTPPRVVVCDSEGTECRVMEQNIALNDYAKQVKLATKTFFTIPAADGTPLNAYILKPEGFDPVKNHPVLMTQYSGPGSQQVLDRWRTDWEEVLTQYGYVVVCVDPRGTGGRGRDFRQQTYGQLGKLETLDQIAAARWIAAQPWADPARIGIYGWSYGGFMALSCILQGADVFKMAIAVAPVTSWRYYDSIYTEIYNGLPDENPAGYDDNSPLTHAAKLRGKLLLVHGSADDNVHVQNSYEMAAALTRAGKPFDMAVYPDCNHSMLPGGRHHVRQRMVDYVLANL
ncbi:MAG: S9 family peptidase [Rikenellaceae bacterium]|jgi:dipeptidyl-peptidase-4|nr:S9 family peptidase [Rikenellaceae bacterium]